jgi:hypothetical protein
MKKPTKAKKTASKKAAAAPKGCCTLSGSGPDEQIEGITQEACRRLGIQKGKNDHWVKGLCAQA